MQKISPLADGKRAVGDTDNALEFFQDLRFGQAVSLDRLHGLFGPVSENFPDTFKLDDVFTHVASPK